MASSRTQREYKALLRDDNYVSPPVTAATRSGKVYKTEAPVRLSKPRYYLPAMETDSKVESVTKVAARTASSTVSRQTGRSSTSFRDTIRSSKSDEKTKEKSPSISSPKQSDFNTRKSMVSSHLSVRCSGWK